MPRAGLGDVK